MLKRKIAIIFLILILLVTNYISMFAAGESGGDSGGQVFDISPDGQSIYFIANATAANNFSFIKWKTAGFNLSLIGYKTTNQDGYLEYNRVGDGANEFTLQIYGSGNTIEGSMNNGQFTELVRRTGGTLYLEPMFTISYGINYSASTGYGSYVTEPGLYTISQVMAYLRDGVSFSSDTEGYLTQRRGMIAFPPQNVPVQVISTYWGKNNDGSAVQLVANVNEYTGEITAGGTQSITVSLSKIFTGYTFDESKLSYNAGASYSDIIKGDPGKIRTVILDDERPIIYVYYTFKQNPPPGSPTLGIDADKTSVEPGESFTIIDESEPSQGATKITSWTLKEEFAPKGGGATQVLQNKTISSAAEFFKSYNKTDEGTYTYTVNYVKDDANKEITGNASVSVTVGAAAPPPPAGIPVAIITAPDTVRAGESLTASGASSYSPNGPIETYSWNNGGGIGTPTGVSGLITYMYAGTYTIGLTVTDSAGVSASTTKTITVTPPYPKAVFIVSGTLKENRKTTLDSTGSTSSPYFPIDHSKDQWTIEALTGGTSGDIKYVAPLNGNSIKDVLYKKAGTYRITLTVTNSYGLSDTMEKIITIVPDEPPIALFDAPTQVLRDPANSKKATISLTDESRSVDGDTISSRVWQYAYDSDNDGLFTDETFTTLDSTNNKTSLSFTVTEVGKYLIRETVTEAFGQATIPAFVTAADYKKAGYDYTSEVINTPPVSSLTVKKIQKADLTVVTDYVGAKLTALTSALSALKSSLFTANVDLNYTVVDGNNKVQVGESLNRNRLVGTRAVMDTGSEYNYGWLGSFYPQIWITPSGTTSTGNGSPNNIISVSTSSSGKMFAAVDANGNLYGWGEPPEAYLNPFPTPAGSTTTLVNFNGSYVQNSNYLYERSGYYVKDAIALDNAIVALKTDGTLEIHGNDSFHPTTYIAAGEGKYYGGSKVIDTDVVEMDGSGYTVIYRKSDGSVWGVGENQYFSAGPNASMWQQTYGGSVIGYGYTTGKNKINLPPIKKIMHSTTLAPENTANPSGSGQGRTIKETSFAIDENNQVWTWGWVMPGTGITPTSERANDAYWISGRGIETIRTPVVISGLNGSEIADISYGTYATDPNVTSYARSSNTLFILKTDGTLWRFNGGTLTRVNSEAYTNGSNYSTEKFNFNKVFAIGSTWYLTAEGTMFGIRGSAWSNFPRYAYSYGLNPKGWLTPVYAPNLASINTSSLRSGSDRYFMWVSDGQGDDYPTGYGNYFGLSNLTTTFVNNIKNSNYAIAAVGPEAAFDYYSGFAAQNTTVRNFVTSSLVSGRLYDAGSYQKVLAVLAANYYTNAVDISVLTDYEGAKLTTLNTQLNTLKTEMASNGITMTFAVNPGSPKQKTMSIIKPGTLANTYYGDTYVSYVDFISPSNPYGFVSQFSGAAGSTSSNRKIYTAVDSQGKLYAWGDTSGISSVPYTPIPYMPGDSQKTTPVNFNVANVLKDGSTLAAVTDKFVDSKVSWSTIFSLTTDGKVIVRGDPKFDSYSSVTAANRTYPAPMVLATNVKQIATGRMSVIMLKNDGTVWAYGNAQKGIAGPWSSSYIRTGNDLNMGKPAITPTPVQIQGLPVIKKVFVNDETALALDENGDVWYWGVSLGTEYNMTHTEYGRSYNGTPVTDSDYADYALIRTVPEKLPNLNVPDAFDIIPGQVQYSFTAYNGTGAQFVPALKILMNDKTLWAYRYNNVKGGYWQVTTEYKVNITYDSKGNSISTITPLQAIQNIVSIGNTWWVDDTGKFFRSTSYSGSPSATQDGATVPNWTNDVYAPNLNGFTASTKSTSNTDKYFLWVSDGEGKNFAGAYGTYFGLTNLSTAFISKLKGADYNIITVSPTATYAYDSDLSTQQATVRQLVDGAFAYGAYYDKGKLADALADIKQRAFTKKDKLLNQFVIVNEDTVTYTPQYSDYESDPKNMEAWKFNHTPTYFENSQGTASYNGQWIASPITTFDKVGRYFVSLRAQDNPKNNSNFMDYWLWGNPSGEVGVIVHRRPVADFSYSLTRSGMNVNFQALNISYDLDHQTEANKGIVASRWKYKKTSDVNWTNGPPATLSTATTYQVSLEVQDPEGAWSYPAVKIIDTADLPPLVDASPTSYTGYDPITVTITANDQGENDFDHTRYAWSASTSKPSSWQTTTSKVVQTVQGTEGTWYLHMEAFDTHGNSFYRYRGPYVIDKPLTITGSVAPNPALAGEYITITCRTTGKAEQVTLQMWNGDTVTMTPQSSVTTDINNWTGGYIVPLNTSDGNYTIRATATRPGKTVDHNMILTIEGNIYQLVKPRIRNQK